MAAPSDSSHVGRHDDHQLRRFLEARRHGDEATARRWWEELLTDNYDRVHGFVLLESHKLLDHHEQEEAFERALIKIANNMFDTFRGTTMGEWVESTRTLVRNVCIDTQRQAARISGRERLLEAGHARDVHDDRDPWDGPSLAAFADAEREREEQEADAELLARGRAFLTGALPRLPPGRRAVIELDLAEVPVEEIQTRLGKSRDAVYQARHRALDDLVKLREQDPS